MKRFKIQFAVCIIVLISFFLISCSDSSENTPENALKTLEKATKKTKEINYMKSNIDFSIGVAGIDIKVKALGELDNIENKSIINLKVTAPPIIAEEMPNIDIALYTDKNIIYMKDITKDRYVKSTSKGEGSLSSSNIFNEELNNLFKNDEKVKETIQMKKDNNSNKIIAFEMDSKGVKDTIIKMLDSKEFREYVLSSYRAQIKELDVSEYGLNESDKKDVEKHVEKETDKNIEQIKTIMKEMDISNIKYNGKINGEGYISSEEFSFDIKEPSSGFTMNIKFKIERSDINANKTVKIPEVPQDKIVDMSEFFKEYMNEYNNDTDGIPEGLNNEDIYNDSYNKDFYDEEYINNNII